MRFKPNFDLLTNWNDAKKSKDFASNSAYIAIFRKDNKTLIYMCDVHCLNISFNMVDMCFADDFGVKPDVLLTEVENTEFERKFNWHGYQSNTLVYAAGIAAQRNIPIVFADLNDVQYIDVVKHGFPDSQITDSDLNRVLSSTPNSQGDLYQRMSAYLDMYGRDRFMIQNIVAALERYDTVFVIFGVGHYENQRLVLEDMLGKPEYITRIKNMRGDFTDVKIEPIKMCDFGIGGINDKNA